MSRSISERLAAIRARITERFRIFIRGLGGAAFDEPHETAWELPPFPYNRESFAVVLGEMQGDGPVANAPEPQRPSWLTLPERVFYTGVFVSGSIGSGMTAGVAWPALEARGSGDVVALGGSELSDEAVIANDRKGAVLR